MAFPIDTPAEMIGQLYVGYFGRAADPDGLNYWINQLNGGMSLQAIANSFAVQPEATALYSYLAAPAVGDPAAFVTAIYQDLFNRGPDAGGLAYWVNQLTVQGTQPGQMVLNIISGAVGADKTSVENKTHVAVDYAQKFVDNNLTWIGIDNIQGARDVVIPVTSDPATVVAAILQIDGIITQELTNPQNIQLTPNLSTIQSGGTVAITLKADPSQANKDFQYTITGVDSSVVKGGTLSGTVKLGSDSTAVINVGTVVTAAQLDTPNETIKVTVGPISTNVGLTEGTQVVTQTGPVNEGNSFNFTVTISGIAAGSANGLVQTYTISGPGLAHIPVGERSGTVTLDNNGVATVTVHTLTSLADSGTTQVTITVGNDAPVNVVINETAVQQITPSAATIQEGAQVIFKVTTTGVKGSAVAGQVENWTLTGAGASQINGPLSGTVTLDQDGTATVTVSTLVNGLNDLSPANLVFTLLSGAVPVGTATVGINQGTQVTTNTGPVFEGEAFSFTVTTSGVAPGSVEGRIESYTITGPGLAHIPVAERSGTVVLDANGSATVTVHTLTDLAGSGTTSVDIQVGNNAASKVTINETAVQTVVPNAATILEGGAVVFTITTLGVPPSSVAGQVETWTLSGAASDQIDGPLSGTVTLDSNGSATVSIQTLADALNDLSPQDLVFTLKSGSSQTAQATVNVNQGIQVTTNTGPVFEGSAFSFTVTTSGVAPGSVTGRQESYTITGPGIDHIPVAERSGLVTLDANGSATVTVDTLVNLGPTGQTTVNVQVGNNAVSTVEIIESAQQNVGSSSGVILEGGSVVFTITTIGVLPSSVAGTVETWTLSGAATSQVDGPLSGTVTLDSNGGATVSVSTRIDALNDGLLKDLVFTLKSGATQTAQASINVQQGTQATTAPNAVVEGGAFTFEVTTTGVAPGSAAGRIEGYTISGPGVAQIPAAERSGTVVLDANGHASVTVHTLVDLGVLGFKPISIQVGNNAAVTLDILDQAFQTVNVSPASAVINQGQSLTFTIDTLGVAGSAVAGTVQSWTLTGSGTNQVTGGVLSGTVTLDANGSAVVTVGTDLAIINGPLTQSLRFQLDSGGSAVLSPIVTIHESTLTVTPPALPVVEGQQVTFTISGVNIPSGTTYTYTLSGEAIGNVVPTSQVHGTVTINNNTATVVVNTLSNDPSGLTKGLTLTIDQVPTAKGTAQISETAPTSFILTTGTDNFTGNPAGDNTFFAVASADIFTTSSTLGQNDNLQGGGGPNNTLFLQTTGLFPQLINAFSTNGIQTFNVNPGQAGAGTTIDMSSVFGMTKLVNANASGKLTLLNLTQATNVELVHPSDIFGSTVDMAVQYQNNPAKPSVQNLLLDPTVSPITGLANTRFWVNVDKVTITSAGPGTNGLLTVNGATNGFGPTALTALTLLGATNFLSGSAGSGQVATTFTNAGFAASSNLLDLSNFGGVYFNIGDAGAIEAITSVGGLTIESGAGGIRGVYVPGPGFTGATQVGGQTTVIGGDFALNLRGGTVDQQKIDVLAGSVAVKGAPFGGAAGGLLNSSVTTFNGAQSYQGFNGGLTGSLTTNGGLLTIGTIGRVNGTIDLKISTDKGQAIVVGGDGNVTLDFSGAGTSGFHKALLGANTEDRFHGGTATNTLIIDPMITNVNGVPSTFGTGLATGVQNITLQSPASTPWAGTEGGTGGVLPTNTVDLGLLNQNSTFTGIATAFPQTIRINGPLGGALGVSGQTFKDAVSGDTFILDNAATPGPGGSMHVQVMAFDFALPTANNVLNFTANNVNKNGGTPDLHVREFEISSASAAQQNPVATANLQMNRTVGFLQTNIFTTLEGFDRLATLDLKGTANRFDDGPGTVWRIIAVGGAGTLTTITGADQNYDLLDLLVNYQSTTGGSITLGNGISKMGANAGNWTIASGKVPGGGTAGDSGDNLVSLSPQLGNLHTARTGGGADTYVIGFGLLPGGGRVDIMSGAGNDQLNWLQSGIFPNLNSAQKVDGGTGRDTFELFSGAINENDSLFGQITNVEILRMAGDVANLNNSLLLNFFANQSGLDTIVTRGKGSSNVFFEGTGFTNRMRYEIATQFDGGGDTGRDAIIVQALPSGSNAITVATTTGGFNIAFESGLMTAAINPGSGLVTKSGIFANPNASDTLELTADGLTANVFALGGFGTHSVETIIGKSGGVGVSQTVWLVSDPALGTGTTTVDLGEVQGNTTVWAQGSTLRETITGGKAGSNILFGGLAADTIKAQGTAPGFGSNFIWGGGDFTGGAQDVETGVQGGAGNNVGTVFYIDAVAESPGGPNDPAFNNKDVHITNFHVDTDTLLINPAALLYGDIPVFLGDALDYGNGLALLAGGNAGFTQAVYQMDDKAMWIDANHDGLLNQLDIRVFIDFASPGFNPGSFNFGTLLGLFTGGQVTNYTNGILNPANGVNFSGTLAPGEFLFGGGAGGNDKLTLSDGNVANGIPVGFEKLEIASGKSGTLSVNQWNGFYPQITGPGTNTAKFLDGIDAIKGNSIQTIQAIESYDFSGLSYGIKMTTPGYLALAAPFQNAGTVKGTGFADTFNVNENDLKAGFTIDGNGGTDTMHVDVNLIYGPVFGAGAIAGVTNAQVTGVEILFLDGAGPNTVGFNPGTAFHTVNGGDGVDRIIDPENLAGAWVLNLGKGANVVQINAAAADISPGTLTAAGGSIALIINAAGASTTKMNFGEYKLFNAAGIGTTGGSTFANSTIAFTDQVTGTTLGSAVGNWVFLSALGDTFTLGAVAQSIDVQGGGADRAILNIAGGSYTGTWLGGSTDDTIQFNANSDISGVNGGGLTTFRRADFNNASVTVSMLAVQDNALTKPFANTGGTQTIVLTRGGGFSRGDVGIESYILTNTAGTTSYNFTVAKDQASLSGGKQNVTFANPGVTNVINFVNGTFTGTVSGLPASLSASMTFEGIVDIKGVNGGAAVGATSAFFSILGTSVTMTTAQHLGLSMVATTPQTITISDGGAVTGSGVIENYVLVGGAGNAHIFTVAKDNGAFKQDVTITGPGANDTIRFGSGTFTGVVSGLDSATDSDVVQFFGNADIKGVNGGLVTGAKTADFSNAAVSVTMTLAQHDGFTPQFTNTGLTQTITLTTSGVVTGDSGIERYILASGDDTFTVAANNVNLVGGSQAVDLSSGGNDTLVFGAGTFTGTYTGESFTDTIRFIGNADISGATTLTGVGNVDFSNANVSVTVNFLGQYQFFTSAGPFANTANVQTITFSSGLTIPTGDVGIENYVFSGSDDQFTVAADNNQLVGGAQNTDFSSGGGDLIAYYNGKYSGKVVGMTTGDRVVFASGAADVTGVNGGAAIGASIVLFNISPVTATMTMAQYLGFTQPFGLTFNSTQTVILTTSGVATGDAGIENYKLGSGDDTFTVAKDSGTLVGGKQNVDIGSGGNDTINYTGDAGISVYTGTLVGGGAGDTVQFIGGAGSKTDVSGVNGPAGVLGPKAVSFNDAANDVTMTVAQHNDLTKPFGKTASTQTITLTTDGVATGDIGIEQYVLGEDGQNTNMFTIGILGQNVSGRDDNDTVINPFGGLSGVLLGGNNTATGDTLILQAANTVLAAGSGEFENLKLTVLNGTVTSDTAAHNGFAGVVDAPGTNNTYTVNNIGGGTNTLTGLAGFENYTLVSTGNSFNFTVTNDQTGTITGSAVTDTFNATAAQVAGLVKIDGGGGSDTLIISTDAAGLNLNSQTAGIRGYQLLAGSTANVSGANGDNVFVNTIGSTIFTMGSVGSTQTYSGSAGGPAGIDDVTFSVGSTSVRTRDANDTVRSLVGGAITKTLDGGAGFDILSLTNNDDLSGALLVANFEDLLLANNASVKMTATQYNQFTTNSAGPGTNTITIVTDPGFLGTTFADVENYVLLDGPGNHTYTIAGSNQTVTDNHSFGFDAVDIVGGLVAVKMLATNGARYIVTDLGGGTNHSIALGGDSDSVRLSGDHTGLFIDLGGGASDLLAIDGIASGTLNSGGGGLDGLTLFDTADISGATVIGFGTLRVFQDASVRMSAETWDQFVGTNGDSTPGHAVLSSLGSETVTLTSTTNLITTAFTGSDRIESYVLSSAANDFFHVNNNSQTAASQVKVNLSGGGSDFVVLNDTTATLNGEDVRTTLASFQSGAAGDVVQIQLTGASLSSGAFQGITAANTNVTQTTVVYSSGLVLLDGSWDQAEARNGLDAALGAGTIATGNYAVTAYFSGGAYVMGVQVVTADSFANANIDLIGVLSNVGVNTLTSNNFT